MKTNNDNIMKIEGQMKFTKSYGDNVLLTASAGSGKTHTMINKLLDIIKNEDKDIRCDISNIMVVTFTKNAANEMKQRLQSKIANDNSISDETKDNVASSDIGTIHSIGHKLISKYFFESGVDQNAAIIETGEAKYLMSTAIDKVLKTYNKMKDKKYNYLYQYFEKNRNNENLIDAIEKVIEFLSTKVDPQKFIDDMLSSFQKNYDENVATSFILKNIKEQILVYAKILQNLYNECRAVDFEKGMEDVNKLLFICEDIIKCQTMPQMIKVFENNYVPSRSITENNYLEINQDINNTQNSFQRTLKKLNEYLIPQNMFDDMLPKYIDIVTKLLEIVNCAYTTYQELKKNRNAIDFNDIERMTVKLLQNENIKKEIQANYKYVFVDEYQDFTDMQEYIVTNISNGHNLYMIGDVKQSIYSFRNCTPNIYLAKMNRYKDGEGGKLFSIQHNFRSHNGILEFVNSIFDKVMTLENTGIKYIVDNDLQGALSTQESNSCEITFDIVDKQSNDDSNESINQLATQKECELICKKILSNVGKEYVDIKTGQKRLIAYSDIAVLIRSRTKIDTLFATLKKYNIPVSLDYNNNIFDDYFVNMIYDTLKCVANDYDDISIASFLVSPIVKMSNDELAQISLFDNSKYFYQKLKNYNVNDDIKYKIDKGYKLLAEFRDYVAKNSVSQLIEYIVDSFDIENLCKTLPNGAISFDNVQQLIKFIKTGNDKNIFKTLSYLDILKDGEKISTTITTAPDAVQVITMHGSKGLEWPVVIVPFLTTKKKEDDESKVLLTDEFGIGLKYRNFEEKTIINSLAYGASKMQKNITEYAESIRLLYVALTRAKNFLYLIGSYKVENIWKDVTKPTYQYKDYLTMILSTMDSKVLKNLSSRIGCTIKYPHATLNINIDDCDNAENESKAPTFEEKYDEKVVDKIIKVQNFAYPYSDEQNITIKNSVTSILKENEDYENVLYVPKTFDIKNGQQDRVDASTFGTAYHKVMQLALNNPDESIENILEKAKKDKNIKEVVGQLDINNIEKTKRDIMAIVGNNQVISEAQFMMKARHCDIVPNSTSDAKILVQGVVDLIVLSSQGAIIVDYKTNKKSIEQLKKMYKLQLDLYAKAVQDGLKVPVVKKYLYSTYNSKLVEL